MFPLQENFIWVGLKRNKKAASLFYELQCGFSGSIWSELEDHKKHNLSFLFSLTDLFVSSIPVCLCLGDNRLFYQFCIPSLPPRGWITADLLPSESISLQIKDNGDQINAEDGEPGPTW